MDRCAITGLTVPECSCRTCLRAQVAEHAPHLVHDNVVHIGTRARVREGVPISEPRQGVRTYGR